MTVCQRCAPSGGCFGPACWCVCWVISTRSWFVTCHGLPWYEHPPYRPRPPEPLLRPPSPYTHAHSVLALTRAAPSVWRRVRVLAPAQLAPDGWEEGIARRLAVVDESGVSRRMNMNTPAVCRRSKPVGYCYSRLARLADGNARADEVLLEPRVVLDQAAEAQLGHRLARPLRRLDRHGFENHRVVGDSGEGGR